MADVIMGLLQVKGIKFHMYSQAYVYCWWLNVVLLQACNVRKALRSSMWESTTKASDSSDLILKEWFKLLDDSKRYVQQQFGPLNEQMMVRGWALKNILLNTEEQTRYSYMDD